MPTTIPPSSLARGLDRERPSAAVTREDAVRTGRAPMVRWMRAADGARRRA